MRLAKEHVTFVNDFVEADFHSELSMEAFLEKFPGILISDMKILENQVIVKYGSIDGPSYSNANGRLDLLGYHRDTHTGKDTLYVIEVKKGEIDECAAVQLWSYVESLYDCNRNQVTQQFFDFVIKRAEDKGIEIHGAIDDIKLRGMLVGKTIAPEVKDAIENGYTANLVARASGGCTHGSMLGNCAVDFPLFAAGLSRLKAMEDTCEEDVYILCDLIEPRGITEGNRISYKNFEEYAKDLPGTYRDCSEQLLSSITSKVEKALENPDPSEPYYQQKSGDGAVYKFIHHEISFNSEHTIKKQKKVFCYMAAGAKQLRFDLNAGCPMKKKNKKLCTDDNTALSRAYEDAVSTFGSYDCVDVTLNTERNYYSIVLRLPDINACNLCKDNTTAEDVVNYVVEEILKSYEYVLLK